MRGRRLPLAPPLQASLDEAWSFALATRRSIYDPWWLTPQADAALAAWRETQ